MDEPIDVAFTIRPDEYVRAIRRHYRARVQVKRDIIGGLLAIGGGIYVLLATESDLLAGVLIIAGAVLVVLVLYALLVLPWAVYRSQSKLKDEYRLSFVENGIGFQTKDVDAALKWSVYHSWLRDEEFFILYHGNRDLSVIPRRALASGDADRRLTSLLNRFIGPPV